MTTPDEKLDKLLESSATLTEKVVAIGKRTDRIEEALVALTRTEEKVSNIESEIRTVKSAITQSVDELWEEHRKQDEKRVELAAKIIEADGFVKVLKDKDAITVVDSAKKLLSNLDKIFIAIALFFILGILGTFVVFGTKNIQPATPTAAELQRIEMDKKMMELINKLSHDVAKHDEKTSQQ